MAESSYHVRQSRRIFPTKAPKQITTTKLSILDASVARFAPCSAIWLYDRTENADAHDPLTFQRLEEALKQTLDDYPHYSGQLRWASKALVEGDVNPRHVGRPIVVYGAADDPGVELVLAKDDRELNAIVPSQEERSSVKTVWRATDFPQNEFVPGTKLAFSSVTDFEGLPGVAIAMTAFKCGGFAIGVKLTHCLSDATCLMEFVHSWAAQSRLLFGDDGSRIGRSVGAKGPVFDPAQLDQYANLTSSGASPDPEKINRARALPMHRYDWWSEGPGYPSWAAASSNRPPAEELAGLALSPSTFPPWTTWNMAAPVEHFQIRFKAESIAKMKKAAEASLPESLRTQRVSRLDSVLAHIWILINRARQHENTEDQMYMDITLGVRSRVEPPLPDSFVGSPILLAYIAKTGSEVTTGTIGSIAGSIRQTASQFTPDAVSAYIHDNAYEFCPHRLWQSFLGSRHTLVTSWVRARAYEVDFCAKHRLARYVQGVMPRMDGLVQVMDVGGTGDFDVCVNLEKEAAQRFIDDPMLKAYSL
ncbi:transferase family protein [Hypoxylon sp. NC1633]|nr:transferase family protein [Hypoxylon sp. NC1633]